MATVEMMKNPLNTDSSVKNCCNYIATSSEKNEYGRYVDARGISVDSAYEDISEMQAMLYKVSGRRGYHLCVSFEHEAPLTPYDIYQIAYEISEWFYPEYQVLYAVHTNKKHLHIQFFINTVTLLDGHKLHLGYKDMYLLQKKVDRLVEKYR